MARKVTAEKLKGLSPKEANFVIEYTKDFSARRAAAASGYAPDSGYDLRDRSNIAAAIDNVISGRLAASDITVEWLLHEFVDNHIIARQQGKYAASNTALGLIAKHKFVDAFAAEKVDIVDDREIAERLRRGRERVNRANSDATITDEVDFF